MNLFRGEDFESSSRQSLENNRTESEVEEIGLNVSPETTSKTVAEEVIRLLEERLVVDTHRRKIGEVVVRKEIETQMVEVPIRREKIIVEQISPEYKQLVSIDLGKDNPNSLLESKLNDQFIDIELARLFLAEVTKKTKVKILFEDSQLQMNYQQWLDQ